MKRSELALGQDDIIQPSCLRHCPSLFKTGGDEKMFISLRGNNGLHNNQPTFTIVLTPLRNGGDKIYVISLWGTNVLQNNTFSSWLN